MFTVARCAPFSGCWTPFTLLSQVILSWLQTAQPKLMDACDNDKINLRNPLAESLFSDSWRCGAAVNSFTW
jgi:hypothetical protein